MDAMSEALTDIRASVETLKEDMKVINDKVRDLYSASPIKLQAPRNQPPQAKWDLFGNGTSKSFVFYLDGLPRCFICITHFVQTTKGDVAWVARRALMPYPAFDVPICHGQCG